MAMNIITTNYTIAQLVGQFDEKKLTINREYQRSDEVWPAFAQSLLVETVLLGYPMPKLTIRQRTDMKNLKTFQEIVDGQQRTKALVDFFHGRFALSNTLDSKTLRDKTIHTLEPEDRERYVTYSVGADLLVGADDAQVIEVFRRMNSYTAPLNPEEQRHAGFQGSFKWFIYDMRGSCESLFSRLGVFNKKAFVRMQDAKLITELCHAALNGITTTNKKSLDGIYHKYNKAFVEGKELKQAILGAVEYLAACEPVNEATPLVKPYNFYSLLVAVMRIQRPYPSLSLGDVPEGQLGPAYAVSSNLSRLSEALEEPENCSEELKEFVLAATDKTNTKANRSTRFIWFYRALTNQMG